MITLIANKWKNVLASRGMTQAQVARAANVNVPIMSMVVNGTGILTREELIAVCKVLDISPDKVYSPDVLKAIYGVEAKKRSQRSVSIKLMGYDLELFNEIKRELGLSELSPHIGLIRSMMLAYKDTLNRSEEE